MGIRNIREWFYNLNMSKLYLDRKRKIWNVKSVKTTKVDTFGSLSDHQEKDKKILRVWTIHDKHRDYKSWKASIQNTKS